MAASSIAGTAASQGIPEIRVTWNVLSPEIRWTIFGSQTPSPTLLVM